ncbi:MAG: putative xanthine dehydrogenase subunit A [Actinobacteria bacterium ADurb.Bin444]|nr:MAG: putative xanthine dehydrogenase subunit A [Actinobacteria bacterium ADurb.Bin444]
MTSQELYKKMAELAADGKAFVLATVVESFGSTPRKAGAKMIVLEDGSTIDTVGGGKVELQVVEDALEALKRGISRTVKYELRTSGEHALGMECGGETTVFLEVNKAAQTLVVAGAGHIAQRLTPMAKLLDFNVIVVDNRPEYADYVNLPSADQVICGHPANLPELVALDRNSYVVIVTHGHLHDKDTLEAVLSADVAYIGMIGSQNKVRVVLEQLLAEGADPERVARVHSPIGLDLGGGTPGEIAVSILSEIIALRHGRLGQFRVRRNPVAREFATEGEAEKMPAGISQSTGSDAGSSAGGGAAGGSRCCS